MTKERNRKEKDVAATGLVVIGIIGNTQDGTNGIANSLVDKQVFKVRSSPNPHDLVFERKLKK